METKNMKFLENKLSELVDNNIITEKQFDEAKNFFNIKKEKKNVSTIFSAIGLLLIGLSIITLFGVNWDNISREFKCVIAFIPTIITSIMLYYTMKNKNKNLERATSIIAPISILATNSLIGQIFHIQIDVYGLIFLSLLMFMPIAFIIKNYISLVVYGVGCIIYAGYREEAFNVCIVALPLVIYNIYNYIKCKEDKKNVLLWTFNAIIVTTLLFVNEILREEIIILYLFILSLITKLLFKKDNGLNKVISFLFMFYLFVICISSDMIAGIRELEFGVDTGISMILSLALFFLTKEYKNINEYFILLFTFLFYIPFINQNITFVLFNLLVLGYGIYKIIYGRKVNSYIVIKHGIATILYLIFVRFVSAEISFMAKTVLFLISGIIFIVGSKIFKRKIEEEKKDEQK